MHRRPVRGPSLGYGGRIHKARFKALAEPGEAIIIDCHTTRVRKSDTKVLARYEFEFRQGDKVVYEGDQTALWLHVREAEAAE